VTASLAASLTDLGCEAAGQQQAMQGEQGANSHPCMMLHPHELYNHWFTQHLQLELDLTVQDRIILGICAVHTRPPRAVGATVAPQDPCKQGTTTKPLPTQTLGPHPKHDIPCNHSCNNPYNNNKAIQPTQLNTS
jgi:hypothetical protein